ncbi:hypothetical protein JCM14076_28760 [Methylosoma difficile]
MSRIVIKNLSQELSNDCSWTGEFVKISSGDLYLDGQPFGTYVAACYPESQRAPQFIINVLDTSGEPLLSLPCEYTPCNENPVLPLRPEDSPWSEDGVVFGSIPSEAELSIYSRASDALTVAKALVLVEPNLVEYSP